MANISDAYGKVAIEFNDFEVLQELLKCFEIAEDWNYFTQLDNENKKEVEPSELKYCVEYNFRGVGRGLYKDNIEYFFHWLKSNKRKLNWKLLEGSDFTLIFDYTDEDSSSLCIYTSVIGLTHHAGNKLPDGAFIDEFVFSELSKQKRDIESYLNKPLVQALQEHGYDDLIEMYNREAKKKRKPEL